MNYEEKVKGTLQTRKGNSYTFEYHKYHNTMYHFDVYLFDIWDENDRIEEWQKANFGLLIMNDGLTLKVIDLFMKNYQGKGIAIALILKAKTLFEKAVISSTNNNLYKSFNGEGRWEEATNKVWKPLVLQGLATYDPILDHFTLS